MKHLFHFAYFFHLFPTKATVVWFLEQLRWLSCAKNRGNIKHRSAIPPFEGRKIVRTWDLDVSVQPIDVRSTSPGCHGSGRVENRTRLLATLFSSATCQLSTKIQDCRTGNPRNPVPPCWGDHFSIGSNVLLPTCPASSECSVNFSPGISEIGSVPLPVPLLCESNQVANQGACSACFRCFSVCSCNMIVAVHDSVWHDLTGIALHEAGCWNFIQNRK